MPVLPGVQSGLSGEGTSHTHTQHIFTSVDEADEALICFRIWVLRNETELLCPVVCL